jgi:hypothetical protein
MPFRERPLHNPTLHWQLATGSNQTRLSIGVLSLAITPRCLLPGQQRFASFHEQRALSCLHTCLFSWSPQESILASIILVTQYPRSLVAKHILPVADRHPQYFYPALVSYLYMVAMVFEPLRDILHYIDVITCAFFARLLAMMHNSRWGFEEVGLIVAIGCVIILILAVRGRSANRAIGTNSNL